RLEGVREIGENEFVADTEALSIVLVHRPALGRVSKDEVEDRVQIRLRVGQLHPAACELDRRLEQLLPGQGAERALSTLEPERRGDGGVNSVPALGQHTGSRGRGQWMSGRNRAPHQRERIGVKGSIRPTDTSVERPTRYMAQRFDLRSFLSPRAIAATGLFLA